MISVILIALAAICNACMDTCEFHYDNSVLTKFSNRWYFDASISWKNKYIDRIVENGMRKWFFKFLNIPVFVTDFWHLCKSLCVTLICASCVLYTPFLGTYITKIILVQQMIDFAVLGTTWNLMFNLFYNKLLLK